MPNMDSILRDHSTLQIECIDRLYLCAYVPRLQRANQLAYFLNVHRGKPLPSPALLNQMTERFVLAIKAFAQRHRIPIVRFTSGERKDDIARRYFARFRGKEGVVFIGVAQECANVFRGKPQRRKNGSVAAFEFFRTTAIAVNQYYFYVLDPEWGPAFIKLGSYAPFTGRVCLNGHEWAKCQLRRAGIGFGALDNGFLACDAPDQLQALCDRLGPDDVETFFRRWLARLPHPFSREDRRAGYRYQLSIWQMEFSTTHVFDRPLHGREFFEEVIRENLDLGRPDRIQLLFGRRVTRRTPGSFRTRVIQYGVFPKLSVQYHHSTLKQYFKENRALRTETAINNPADVGVRRGLSNLPYLRDVARHVNHRLLALERTSHNCTIAARTFDSVVLPSIEQRQHAPGLRYGDPRVMALLAALCHFAATPDGFSNARLRTVVAALHDPGPHGYGPPRMTYDLRRLRLKGLISRVAGTHRYVLTPIGRRVALFFAKTYARILRPGLARLDPALPLDPSDPLALAWQRLDRAIDRHIATAKLAA
jgi:hypothetical protein